MNSTSLPNERRSSSRIPVVISVRERSANGVVMCVATDISRSGMALKRAADTAPASPVTLEFSLPGINGLVSVTARFIRQFQTASVQVGAVSFEEVPDPLAAWFSVAGQSPVT